jgi:hypothetical protein
VRVDDEIMLVTARAANTLTVTRGAEGTTAATHSDGADIDARFTADALVQAIKENAPATGTAFPGGPATGDRYRRSDLEYLVFFYDGTRWLSEMLYHVNMPPYNSSVEQPVTGSPLNMFRYGISSTPDLDMWVMDFFVTARGNTTNNGTHYWTMKLQVFDGSTADVLGTADTSGFTVDVAGRVVVSVDAVVDVSVELLFQTQEAKVGSPGALDLYMPSFTYRLIAT